MIHDPLCHLRATLRYDTIPLSSHSYTIVITMFSYSPPHCNAYSVKTGPAALRAFIDNVLLDILALPTRFSKDHYNAADVRHPVFRSAVNTLFRLCCNCISVTGHLRNRHSKCRLKVIQPLDDPGTRGRAGWRRESEACGGLRRTFFLLNPYGYPSKDLNV